MQTQSVGPASGKSNSTDRLSDAIQPGREGPSETFHGRSVGAIRDFAATLLQ